jgi:hypothetical protein
MPDLPKEMPNKGSEKMKRIYKVTYPISFEVEADDYTEAGELAVDGLAEQTLAYNLDTSLLEVAEQ